jgi:hypothetical protein
MLDKKNTWARASIYSLLLISGFILWGCSTRSISNSGYDGGGYYYRQNNPLYKGELTEFDVLGIDPAIDISDEEISKSLTEARKVSIKQGDSMMLIQSGAMFPDEPMQRAFEKHFPIMPFSGIPLTDYNKESSSTANYGQALRLAAAKGGNEIIVCYWGVLETAQRNLATRAVSWVPVAGWMVPDESQMMRIRLKLAIIDVATGSWTVFAPDPVDDTAISAMLNRESSDQNQVAMLKEKAYRETVEELVQVYKN